MTTNNLWFWQQNQKKPVRPQVEIVHQTEISCSKGHNTHYMTIKEVYVSKVEVVHQTEISCSRGHPTHYMKIRPVYDTYGYKEPGRVVCELCGTLYRLMEPTLEE